MVKISTIENAETKISPIGFAMNSSEKKMKREAVHLKVTGDIVGEQAITLEKRFSIELNDLSSEDEVLLDLRMANRIDSRGISLCVGLFKECSKRNARFSIEACSEAYRILTQIKLDKLIDIQEVSE